MIAVRVGWTGRRRHFSRNGKKDLGGVGPSSIKKKKGEV